MAITAVTPASGTPILHGSTVAFTIDDTYTSVIIQVQTAGPLEKAYDTALGGAQAGYTVVVVDNGDGTHTFTFSRDAGWDNTPQLIYVTEDETGSSATTNLSYSIGDELAYPQGTQPYNAVDATVGTVQSVFGRSGAVLAATSDYDASQVDNDSSVAGATVKDALDTLDTSISSIASAEWKLAWEWNGTDTTQFDGTSAFSTSSGETLTTHTNTDTDLPYDKFLDFSSTGTGTGAVVWLATQPLSFTGTDRMIRITGVVGNTPTATGYWGFSFYGDDAGANYYGYQVLIGSTAGWRSRIDNGVLVSNATTPSVLINGSGRRGSTFDLIIRGRKPASTNVEFNTQGTSIDLAVLRAQNQFQSDFQGEPTGASWDTIEGTRFGLALQAAAGGAYGDVHLAELKVYTKA